MTEVGGFRAFARSFRIQLRVIYALLMREIITRYGRKNIGFLWLFLEPMIFTGLVSLFWSYIKDFNHAGRHIDIIPFALIGYSVVLCWRNAVSRTTKAVSANSGLLYHRNVTVLDVFLSRIFLEVYGALVSFLTLFGVFYFVGEVALPSDALYMLFGFGLLVWFSIAISFIIGALCEMSEVVSRLWSAFSIIMFPISGVAFFVYWLPDFAKEFILYIPMVHLTEMIRHGYYGDLIPTFESISYIVWCNMVLSFFGLALVRRISVK